MDPRNAKEAAREALSQASYDAKKIALIYAVASVLFSLLCSVLSYVMGIAATKATGLNGLATRALLESIRTVLDTGSGVAIILWQVGLVSTALRYSKKESVDHRSLMEGFRRWGAVLRLSLLLFLLVLGLMFACTYLATMIYAMSPLATPLVEKMNALGINSAQTVVTEEMIAELIPLSGGLVVVMLLVLIAVGLPLYYRYRMCELALMNGATGARAAIRESKSLSYRRRMDMFKLDLSFWWFYLLMLLASVIANLNLLPELLGVTLPVSTAVLDWGSYLLSLGVQFLIAWKFTLYYHTAYAVLFNRLKEDSVLPNMVNPIMTDIPPNSF